MPVAKLHESQVLGALKATRSNDRDVLFACKEELLQDTNRMRPLGIVPIFVGILMTLTIVGAIVGLPMLAFGIWVQLRIGHNRRTAETALRQHLQSLAAADPALGIAAVGS